LRHDLTSTTAKPITNGPSYTTRWDVTYLGVAMAVDTTRATRASVQSIAVWAAAFSAALAVTQPWSEASRAGTLATLALPVAVLVGLACLRGRTPGWFVHAATAVLAILTLVTAWSEPTDEEAIATGSAMIAPILVYGLWNKAAFTFAYAGAGSLGLLVIVGSRGWADAMVTSWMTVTAVLAGCALVITATVRRTVHLTYHDNLTGLLNRAGLDAYLSTHGRAGRAVLPRSIVSIDVDRFKEINDSMGHGAGDAALQELAASWVRTLRPDDVAARLGGDEFVLILPQTPVPDVDDVLDRLRAASEVEWSAGIASWPADMTFDEALALADTEMYREKRTHHAND
jgi:diguanylate cyclase (GGDEF)-like protein